jgi:hypothetical protein
MRLLKRGLVGFCAVFAVGCGGVETGLPKIDEEHVKAWKASLLKSCTLEAVFPSLVDQKSNDPLTPSIDARLLFERAKGSSLLEPAAGELVLLGAPSHASGYSAQRRSTTINDASFSAEVVQQGATCTVTLNGEELFSGELFNRVPLEAAIDAQSIGAAEEATYSYLEGRAAGLGSSPDLVKAGSSVLLDPVMKAIRPTARALDSLARMFSVEAKTLEPLFPLGAPRLPVAGRVTGLASTPAFGARSLIIGPTADLRDALKGEAGRSIQIEWLIPRRKLSSDPGVDLLTLNAELVLSKGAAVPTAFDTRTAQVALTSLSLGEGLAFSDTAASSCFVQRYNGQLYRDRTVDSLLDGCEALTGNMERAIGADPQALSAVVLNSAVELADPARPFRTEWTRLLTGIAVEKVEAGEALRTALGNGGPVAIDRAIANYETLESRINEPEQAKLWRPQLVRLVFGWEMGRVTPPSLPLLGDMVARHGKTFPLSVKKALEANESNPSSPAAQAPLRCTLDAAAVQKTLDRTRTRSVFSDWQDQASASVLQWCWQESEVLEVNETLDALIAFSDEDRQLAGSDTGLFDLHHRELINQALAELWTSREVAVMKSVLDYARTTAKFSYCDAAPYSSRAHCVDSNLSQLSVSAAKLLDRSFAGRYGPFAARLMQVQQAWLKGSDFFNPRFDIEQAFFGENALWASCPLAEFDARVSSLFDLLEKLRTARGFEVRYPLEQQIDKLVSSSCG